MNRADLSILSIRTRDLMETLSYAYTIALSKLHGPMIAGTARFSALESDTTVLIYVFCGGAVDAYTLLSMSRYADSKAVGNQDHSTAAIQHKASSNAGDSILAQLL